MSIMSVLFFLNAGFICGSDCSISVTPDEVFGATDLFGGGYLSSSFAENGPISTEEGLDQPADSQPDLSGFWKDEDGRTVLFVQDGANLKSRFSKDRSMPSLAESIVDFNATIQGRLVHGVYREGFSESVLEKCSIDKWVGIGLTLNNNSTELRGFRIPRSVELGTCVVTYNDPVQIKYTRMIDEEGNPLK